MNELDACRAVLIEVLTILAKDLDKLAVVGGWVPELAFPNKGQIGSLDVDLALDARKLEPKAYECCGAAAFGLPLTSMPANSNPKPTSRSERSWRTPGISSPRRCGIGSFVTFPASRFR